MHPACKAVKLLIGIMFIAIVNKISPCFVQYRTRLCGIAVAR